ncbi:hypothetical protein E2C01_031675 [Portunus trituberculatus]|uniref:Uncharacterized protein n=1 Tax=Portunus trituberculatus TaxID=210409 RepID=A0A5B7EVC2_PORTR|nr:hypothetical protein [Portunus trituberculatus]
MRFPLVKRVEPTSPSRQSQHPHFRQSSCQYISSAFSRNLGALWRIKRARTRKKDEQEKEVYRTGKKNTDKEEEQA